MNFTPRKSESSTDSNVMSFPSVEDCMARNEITLSPEMTIVDAIDVILINKLTGAPVMDSDRKIVGMLTEKDCLRLLIDSAYNNMPYHNRTVEDYMSKVVKSVSVDSDILDVANEFLTTTYRKFPVITADGHLVGQISRRDVLRTVRDIKKTTW